jgi:catechol 2,3-dioxygenase-like lactoylglutathione lyase family enzyme
MKAVRIDHVTVVSPDAARAADTFARLFGLADAGPVTGRAAGSAAARALAIGDARLEFVTPPDGSALAEALRTGGEGMAALTLQVADLDDARRALAAAGIASSTRTVDGRPAVDVDPSAAHGVRLTLVPRM